MGKNASRAPGSAARACAWAIHMLSRYPYVQAVKAMRYEPSAQQKPSLENAETVRERVKLEEEAAKAAAEEDDEF